MDTLNRDVLGLVRDYSLTRCTKIKEIMVFSRECYNQMIKLVGVPDRFDYFVQYDVIKGVKSEPIIGIWKDWVEYDKYAQNKMKEMLHKMDENTLNNFYNETMEVKRKRNEVMDRNQKEWARAHIGCTPSLGSVMKGEYQECWDNDGS